MNSRVSKYREGVYAPSEVRKYAFVSVFEEFPPVVIDAIQKAIHFSPVDQITVRHALDDIRRKAEAGDEVFKGLDRRARRSIAEEGARQVPRLSPVVVECSHFRFLPIRYPGMIVFQLYNPCGLPFYTLDYPFRQLKSLTSNRRYELIALVDAEVLPYRAIDENPVVSFRFTDLKAIDLLERGIRLVFTKRAEKEVPGLCFRLSRDQDDDDDEAEDL